MKKISLFCDGSSLGNPGFGGYCAILKFKDKERIIKGAKIDTTNNQMELTAVIEGLKALKEPCEVDLVSDSTYVVKGYQMSGWRIGLKKGFKKGKKSRAWEAILEGIKNPIR